jgi:hypothetical protein
MDAEVLHRSDIVPPLARLRPAASLTTPDNSRGPSRSATPTDQFTVAYRYDKGVHSLIRHRPVDHGLEVNLVTQRIIGDQQTA